MLDAISWNLAVSSSAAAGQRLVPRATLFGWVPALMSAQVPIDFVIVENARHQDHRFSNGTNSWEAPKGQSGVKDLAVACKRLLSKGGLSARHRNLILGIASSTDALLTKTRAIAEQFVREGGSYEEKALRDRLRTAAGGLYHVLAPAGYPVELVMETLRVSAHRELAEEAHIDIDIETIHAVGTVGKAACEFEEHGATVQYIPFMAEIPRAAYEKGVAYFRAVHTDRRAAAAHAALPMSAKEKADVALFSDLMGGRLAPHAQYQGGYSAAILDRVLPFLLPAYRRIMTEGRIASASLSFRKAASRSQKSRSKSRSKGSKGSNSSKGSRGTRRR
jgi:hypothetical protein